MADGPDRGIRDLVRDHLLRIVGLLAAFLLASVAVIVSDAPLWSKATAAAFALVGLSLVALWLPLSRSDWTARRGLRVVCVVVPLVAAGIVIGLGLSVWKPDPAYRSSTSRLIIVDGSASMMRSFSPETKFDSARTEILRYVNQQPSVDVALRFTSGRCDGIYEEPDVDFGRSNRKEIDARLRSRRLAGEANFIDAVSMGVNDFLESHTASSAKVQSIWLFLGTAKDGCVPGRDVVEELKAALVDSPDVNLSHVDFFALRAEKTSFQRLQKRIASLAEVVRVLSVPQNVQNSSGLRETIEETARREAPSE